MTEMLDRENFLNHCQRVLEPCALFGVAKTVAERIAHRAARYAYYFNPHLVFARILRFPSTNESSVREAIQSWCSNATAAFHGNQRDGRSSDQHLGGVPEGYSNHDELYFEIQTGEYSHSLHKRGRSFRVRVTIQDDGSDPYSGRLLMVLTRYPVSDDQLGAIGAENYWKHLELHEFPSFAPLDSLRSALANSTALPCVVECFVVYCHKEAMIQTLLDELAKQGQIGDVQIVARFQKTSVKFDLRRWRQNAVTGEMDPCWAYLTFDRISAAATESPALTAIQATSWQDLRQIELEVGPSIETAKTALAMIEQFDRQLGGKVGVFRSGVPAGASLSGGEDLASAS